ncbi:MAG: HzsA-related protein, partial [Planctomycetota bacterium]
DREQLHQLIEDCRKEHGASYSRYERHLSDLRRLHGEARKELSELQRAVLLFDVNKVLAIRRHEITASHVYTYHYEGFKPGGGLYVFDVHDPKRAPLELVSSPTGQILDCDLSYDGKVVLFSWRRQEDEGYHLWTIRVDGTQLKRITDGPWHDYNACWLPDGGIAFLSSRSPQFAYCWHAPVGVVYRMNADGTNIRKISSNYLNDFTPYALHDGRIIYSRWEYVDKPAIPIQSLWTINPDGTNLSMYFGNGVISPGTFMEPRQIPGTNKIICTMTGHNGPTRGAIGIIDRSRGLNAQASIQNITPDVHIPPVGEGNGNTPEPKPYSCPLPLDSRRFLVSAQGPVLVRTISGECQSVVLPGPKDGTQYFSAQPVRPRPRPPVIASALDRSSNDRDYAYLYLQDVYQGLEPHVKRGQIKRIRVVQELSKSVRIDPRLRAFGFQFPVISCGATYAGKKVLGEVDVEPDGSAYFRVPARVPIYFMVLDEKGRALQRMRSFTHLMPGETQGCVGCHEPRRQTPPVRRGRGFVTSPKDLEPPEWGTVGFDYSRIVQPILDEHCAECHNSIDPPNGIDLAGDKTDFFNVSYDVLARDNQGRKGSPYISWIPTYNGHEQNILEVTPMAWGSPQSKLAEVILSGHPDSDGKQRIRLDDKSRRRILAWIDLNVPYYGTSETAYPENAGCRRIYPENLDKVLADVAKRRCGQCHRNGEIPRRVWTRVTEPQLNDFLLAPLARAAGGNEKCKTVVFADTSDRDYQAILATFRPTTEMLKQIPRMDMPAGRPALNLCRDCQ